MVTLAAMFTVRSANLPIVAFALYVSAFRFLPLVLVMIGFVRSASSWSLLLPVLLYSSIIVFVCCWWFAYS